MVSRKWVALFVYLDITFEFIKLCVRLVAFAYPSKGLDVVGSIRLALVGYQLEVEVFWLKPLLEIFLSVQTASLDECHSVAAAFYEDQV